MIAYAPFQSPIGRILLAKSGKGICRICLPGEGEPALLRWLERQYPGEEIIQDAQSLNQAKEEIAAYLAGETRVLTFPLDLRVTPFQRRVLNKVEQIPYGETLSYKTLARRSGRPRAVRAAAGAVAANPLPLVIPCHRVIAHDGSLGGYGGGLSLKRRLLRLEGTL